MKTPLLSENEFILLGTSSEGASHSITSTLHWEDALSGGTMVLKTGMFPVLTEPLSSGDLRH